MNKLTPEEAREKRHNPWYCKECGKLVYIAYVIYFDIKNDDDTEYHIPLCPICKTLNVVEKRERETPEEFENRTGRPWADDSAVYMKVGKNEWRIMTYREAKNTAECCRMDNVPYQIYCSDSDTGIPENTLLYRPILADGLF
jgi:phage FluMu protein Com